MKLGIEWTFEGNPKALQVGATFDLRYKISV
jgi:hypothetical protein